MLGHMQVISWLSPKSIPSLGLSFGPGPHERHGEYTRHDVVACYGIVMYLLTTCVVVFKVNTNAAKVREDTKQATEKQKQAMLISSISLFFNSRVQNLKFRHD